MPQGVIDHRPCPGSGLVRGARLAVFALAASGAGAPVLAQSVADDPDAVLIIGTEANYPPFNAVHPDGRFSGFDIDVGDAVCARMGRDCAFVIQDWDGLIPHLLGGRYDLIIAAMSITDERMEQIAFSVPYADVPLWVVAPKDGPLGGAESLEDLRAALDGAVVGVQISTTQEYVLTALDAGATIQLYPTHDDVMLDLMSGRLDAVAADSVAFQHFLGSPEGEGYGRVGPPLTSAEFPMVGHGLGIAMRREDTTLKAEIDAALEGLHADGTLRALSETWFGFDITAP